MEAKIHRSVIAALAFTVLCLLCNQVAHPFLFKCLLISAGSHYLTAAFRCLTAARAVYRDHKESQLVRLPTPPRRRTVRS